MHTSEPSISDPQAMAQHLRRRYAMVGLKTSTAIAARTGINQSQVYRNLFGRPRRLSKTLRRLCIYADSLQENDAPDPRTSEVLMQALGSVWNGTPEHAQRIADMLLSIRQATL